ncbi:MAG: hypothetical protein HOD63_04570 [Bacteroidetes bacterium]|nr:hypothetical protein [Bacteroidota bacterium]MBT4337839.1 hypothetical protein [Bacteroidota bacterium]MBT5530096.1 hypothetical protein [Cytophagia bacterium]
MMKQEFEIIGIYQNVQTAHVLRTRLESEGIEAWVTDENSLLNSGFFLDNKEGAKLQVKREDASKAKMIIDNIE